MNCLYIFGTFHSWCPPIQEQVAAVDEPILNLQQGAMHMEETFNNLIASICLAKRARNV